MNTFRAKLLPCAGTAGGASPQARAAGQSIIVCGDLSARRPGRATRKLPLPAERQRLGAISNYQPLTRVSRLSAQTAGRREVVTDRIRVRRGPALGGIWKDVRLLNPARNLILGSARVQLRQKSRGRSAQTFHFLTSIGRSFHEREGSREDLSWMTRNVTGIAKCL